MADYNSIHTGAQIDEGVGRALSGRAGINPNLLDNWYFGNPVDQRGGYVVPPGTQVYSDTSLTSPAHIAAQYIPAQYVNGTYSFAVYSADAIYVVPTSSLVRGYTGAGYTIDRWYNAYANGVVTITDNGVTLGAFKWLVHRFENHDFIGKTSTASVLFADGELCYGTAVYNGGDVRFCSSRGYAVHVEVVDNGGTTDPEFRLINFGETAEKTIVAVKLELGSTQTLAHQDADGNWVLNETPNYGEQLAKCQRYFYAFDFTDWAGVGAYWGRGISSTEIELYNLTFPVTMRINPALNNLKVYEDGSGNTYDVVPSSFFLKKEGFRRIDISSGMTAIEGRTYVVVKAWISADL